jgi:hypothetical protein
MDLFINVDVYVWTAEQTYMFNFVTKFKKKVTRFNDKSIFPKN